MMMMMMMMTTLLLAIIASLRSFEFWNTQLEEHRRMNKKTERITWCFTNLNCELWGQFSVMGWGSVVSHTDSDSNRARLHNSSTWVEIMLNLERLGPHVKSFWIILAWILPAVRCLFCRQTASSPKGIAPLWRLCRGVPELRKRFDSTCGLHGTQLFWHKKQILQKAQSRGNMHCPFKKSTKIKSWMPLQPAEQSTSCLSKRWWCRWPILTFASTRLHRLPSIKTVLCCFIVWKPCLIDFDFILDKSTRTLFAAL